MLCYHLRGIFLSLGDFVLWEFCPREEFVCGNFILGDFVQEGKILRGFFSVDLMSWL